MDTPDPGSTPRTASETAVERRVEWYDTDASGHQHHSAVLRWVEAAEAELLRRHGLDRLFGRTPRVRHEVNYRARLWFGETVTTRLRMVGLGRTSLTYAFEVRGREGVAADGTLVVAHAEPDSPAATPWPQDVRDALEGERDTRQGAPATASGAIA
ncbi:acyl-CoA thioesterase [Streptomyces sp. NBC_01320]|uniref:acyl-CoA thioesterase n=1 Tax=Streptomyces sp. NBC_01320 TaxID=2903824 RepID=UPI002E0D5797|nr:acyl-CoA thioesterase [Streptomyces sp. NBC_01320]